MNEKELLPDERSKIRIRNMLASIERTFLPVNSIIGKYRIIGEIDRGGMAVVYKATQLDLDRVVALKVMPANISINPGFVERFLTEAHAIAKLNHSNIVKIYEIATEKNIYYLAMEYIAGKNLYYYLHHNKPKLVDVLEIIVRLTDALFYAHEQKIIHRDLKLNNIIMRDNLSPVLIDFGLAKAMENDETARPGITRTGEIMGSPSYMAPERLLGGIVDHRSDICSLGIMLYEMLTFKNPYLDQRNLHQTTINVMESDPIPPRRLIPWLPVEIEAITLKAMAKDPNNRYQTMREFKADIVRYQHGDPVIARPPSVITKAHHYVKKHWAPLVITMIVLSFSSLFIATLYLQNQKVKSHWQIIYNESMFCKENEESWLFNSDSITLEGNGWSFDSGTLGGNTNGKMYALLNKHFNRDILIKCDIKGNPKNIYNAGIFLSGDQPDSGYCFYVNKDGLGESGIVMGGVNLILRDISSAKVPLTNENHVSIERIQDYITFSINGVVVTKVYDNYPILGKGHDKIGFFITNGAARFDNLKVYRRAIPQFPSPSLIADRFCERGDFEAALEEYNGLLIDLEGTEKAKEIKVKIIDCLVRLNKFKEAEDLIRSYILTYSNKEEAVDSRLYFLKAFIASNKGKKDEADSIIKMISVNYPMSGVNQSAMNSAISRCIEHLHNDRPDLSQKDILLFSKQYRRCNSRMTLFYDQLLDYYIQKNQLDSAIFLATDFIDKHGKNDLLSIDLKLKLGYMYLNKGKIDDAKEVFDQLITANASSVRLWEALFGMAEVNEYEFKYKDAIALYKKIYKKGPRSSPVTWMAGIAFAIHLQRDSIIASREVFANVNNDIHPFPLPRTIAQWYLDQISIETFYKEWSSLCPKNQWYLYYIAQKDHIKGDDESAKSELLKLRENVSKKEWNYFRVFKILNNYSRW